MRRIIVCLSERGLRPGRNCPPRRLAVRFNSELPAEIVSIESIEGQSRARGVSESSKANCSGRLKWGLAVCRSIFLVAAMLFHVSAHADSCPLFITASAAGYSTSYNFRDYYSYPYYAA